MDYRKRQMQIIRLELIYGIVINRFTYEERPGPIPACSILRTRTIHGAEKALPVDQRGSEGLIGQRRMTKCVVQIRLAIDPKTGVLDPTRLSWCLPTTNAAASTTTNRP